MNFEAIFNYQEVDRKLIAINAEVASSKESKNLAAAKIGLNEATETVKKLNVEAGDLFNQYNKCAAELQELDTKVSEIENLALSTADMGEIEYYEKKIAELSEKAEAVKKEFDKFAVKCDTIRQTYDKAAQSGVKYTELYKNANVEYNALIKSRMDEVNEIKNQLATISKDVSGKLLEAYNARRHNKKFPVFVKYDKENKSCVCGMNLPIDCTDKLKVAGDIAECPNCSRILIVTE